MISSSRLGDIFQLELYTGFITHIIRFILQILSQVIAEVNYMAKYSDSMNITCSYILQLPTCLDQSSYRLELMILTEKEKSHYTCGLFSSHN